MGPSARQIEKLDQSDEVEKYAQSLAKLRLIGGLLVDHELDHTHETLPLAEAHADFTSAVREMIRTDDEFGGQLDIDDKRSHLVIDGMARDIEGRPIVELVEHGAHQSAILAESMPVFAAQAKRDEADILNAQAADQLLPGQCRIVLSMEPKRELESHKETYLNLGYREGLTYLQWYARVGESELVAGSFSVDMSDEQLWREIFAEEGIDIPADESPNTWILHAIEMELSAEDAESYVRNLRQRFYIKTGLATERLSVSDFVAAHQNTVDHIFNTYYPALAEAVVSGDNNPIIRDLAISMLGVDLSNMKPTVRQHLMRMASSNKFDDDLARTMESVIRYAVVEELRKSLPRFVTTKGLVDNHGQQNRAVFNGHIQHQLNELLANNVSVGVLARRSYGGCAGQVELSMRTEREGNNNSPQEAYGGNTSYSERVGKTRIDKCVIESCPTRPKKVLVGGCGVCLGRCQELFNEGKDPTKMKPLADQANKKSEEAIIIPFNRKKTEKLEKVVA